MGASDDDVLTISFSKSTDWLKNGFYHRHFSLSAVLAYDLAYFLPTIAHNRSDITTYGGFRPPYVR
ncbi:hypothetical protein CW304_32985 [Bacillus sp. UFRGS-B20]|nr:hypothetical protein CW304_32985 [Bacillus sp. UFRGS-B20]